MCSFGDFSVLHGLVWFNLCLLLFFPETLEDEEATLTVKHWEEEICWRIEEDNFHCIPTAQVYFNNTLPIILMAFFFLSGK